MDKPRVNVLFPNMDTINGIGRLERKITPWRTIAADEIDWLEICAIGERVFANENNGIYLTLVPRFWPAGRDFGMKFGSGISKFEDLEWFEDAQEEAWLAMSEELWNQVNALQVPDLFRQQ
jgi:hypothetical protein